MSEIGLGDFISDESTSVEDGRVGVELHRLHHVLLDDADLERQRRHADFFLVDDPIFYLFSSRPANSNKSTNQQIKMNRPFLHLQFGFLICVVGQFSPVQWTGPLGT